MRQIYKISHIFIGVVHSFLFVLAQNCTVTYREKTESSEWTEKNCKNIKSVDVIRQLLKRVIKYRFDLSSACHIITFLMPFLPEIYPLSAEFHYKLYIDLLSLNQFSHCTLQHRAWFRFGLAKSINRILKMHLKRNCDNILILEL